VKSTGSLVTRTGAFKFESFEPGIVARFVRNENYHFEGRPYVDSVEVRALPDVTSRTNALTTGEIDWMAVPDLKTLDLLARDPKIEITEVAGYAHYTLQILMAVAPFDDANVRMAIKHCIDRDEIVEKIFLEHALPANDNPIPTSVKYGIDPQPVHSYNPDKARKYLAAAGLDSLSVEINVSDAAFAGAVDAALLIRESAAKCGTTSTSCASQKTAIGTTSGAPRAGRHRTGRDAQRLTGCSRQLTAASRRGTRTTSDGRTSTN
jgi:peptide/nickel transport system substrate-binding protein